MRKAERQRAVLRILSVGKKKTTKIIKIIRNQTTVKRLKTRRVRRYFSRNHCDRSVFRESFRPYGRPADPVNSELRRAFS